MLWRFRMRKSKQLWYSQVGEIWWEDRWLTQHPSCYCPGKKISKQHVTIFSIAENLLIPKCWNFTRYSIRLWSTKLVVKIWAEDKRKVAKTIKFSLLSLRKNSRQTFTILTITHVYFSHILWNLHRRYSTIFGAIFISTTFPGRIVLGVETITEQIGTQKWQLDDSLGKRP
jgi:hypothetical protein